VCLDDDPLGPGPLQTWHARGWAARRAAWQQGDGAALLLVAEPTPTLTGIAAAERLIAGDDRIEILLSALASGNADGLDPRECRWVARAAEALGRNPGRGLVTIGAHQPAALQRIAAQANARFGNAASAPVPVEPLDELLDEMRAGRIETLLVLDANPAHSAPGFAQAVAHVGLRIHAGLHADETAALSHWHAPLAHDLESWGDGVAADGTACLIQPLVRPWLDVRSKSAFLAALTGQPVSDHDLVRETWRGRWQGAFEERWRDALLSGVAGEAPPPAAPRPPVDTLRLSRGGLTLLVRPDPTIWDGRFASNPWLQELPKPLTKIVWGNAIHISPALARENGIEQGDELELTAGGRSVTGPAAIVPGQERDTVLVHLGYGRATGTVATNLGFNAAVFGPAGTVIDQVSLRRSGSAAEIAATQRNFETQPGEFVRTVGAPDARLARHAPLANTYPPLPMTSPSWGMAIDLDLCIGCNACVTACTAENNVPMVGAEEVAKGREMHWLRIDRYQEGDADAPRHSFQPVPCMHCEDAPCEMGCPVNAAVHSPDGLNLQVYNRCIGTRTCSAYCPYKVRKFNWFDYTADDPPQLQAARNPEVTVRARGVMEKCTYCIQRLQDARIEGEVDGNAGWSAQVQTACQQACPTQAIVFGDVSDPESAVSQRKAKARNYALLEEANTRPRTTYLARIREQDGEG
jgi:molybdopterin-containing oxidoreductase family iron-sulfur binding subunit